MPPRAPAALAAPRAGTWAVLPAAERWPEGPDPVPPVPRLDRGALGVGSRVRIEQPRLRPAVWTVTEWSPVDGFVWTWSSPGLSISAAHRVTGPAAPSRATLAIDVAGLLAPVISFVYGRLMRRYLAMEAAGLKSRSERPER